MNNPRSAGVVRWSARISGGLLLIFLLFMLIGHLFGDANGPNGMTFSSSSDAVAFVLFPICLMIGLVIAYKWEMQGGLLATLSMTALCILRPELLRWSFLALMIPGMLYLIHWVMIRHGKGQGIQR